MTAVLSKATLVNATVDRANSSGAVFDLDDPTRAIYRRVDVGFASSRGALLRRAILPCSRIEAADVEGAMDDPQTQGREDLIRWPREPFDPHPSIPPSNF